MSSSLPPKPKIDISQYLNDDGSIKKINTARSARGPEQPKHNTAYISGLSAFPISTTQKSPRDPGRAFDSSHYGRAESLDVNLDDRAVIPPNLPKRPQPYSKTDSDLSLPPPELPPRTYPRPSILPSPHPSPRPRPSPRESPTRGNHNTPLPRDWTPPPRHYAPRPSHHAVPLSTHDAELAPPSQVPVPFLKSRARKLLAANARYVCALSGSKVMLYSWRSSSLIWEQKQPVEVAAFVPDISSVWLGLSTGDILIVDCETGTPSQSVRKVHSKPITFIAVSQKGIISISGSEGKVNLWSKTEGALPVRSYRIPPRSQLSSTAGPLLWTAKDQQINAYDPGGETFHLLSLNIPVRGANLGAVTSVSALGDLAFFGHNDGMITVFRQTSQLGSINGGIYSITSLAALSSTELWVGTRSGDILIYTLRVHYGPREEISLSAKLSRQWKAHSSSVSQILLAQYEAAVLSVDKTGEVVAWNSTPTSVLPTSPSDVAAYKVQVITWNVDACSPESVNPRWFLDPAASDSDADIIVVGLQEVIPLESKSQNARKMMMTGDAEVNGEYTAWVSYLELLFIPLGYTLVTSKPMVGLISFLFARRKLVSFLSDVNSQIVKTGLGGVYGNKGGVIFSFNLAGMSFSMVNCHLAAGHTAIIQRNRDATQILDASTSPSSAAVGASARACDVCFFFGDTNYRINAAREQADNFIREGNWEQLKRRDQLTSQISKNPSFCLGKFREGPLKFPPTYKFDPGTHRYDTSDKKRIPSWCDRILYRGKGIQVRAYYSMETQVSDHKAVFGSFTVPKLI